MIKVNIIGFKQFEQTFKKLPYSLREDVRAETKLAAEQFRGLAIKDAPADVGFLRSQITVKEEGSTGYSVVSGSKYSAPMEFGTKGKFRPIQGIGSSEFKRLPRGGTFKEMLKNIEGWVNRKGIVGRTGNKASRSVQTKQLAYLIARSILNNGVTPHPFFFKQTPIVRRDFFRNLRNILNQSKLSK